MKKKYDVVIVGAGPAGLMTAKSASESGLKIALLERKTDISKICRTDGGVIGIDEYGFGEVVKFNRKNQTFVFPVNGFSLKYDGPWSDELYGFHIYSPGGKRFMLGDWRELKKDPVKNSRGICLSKGRLLQGILDDAMANGVEFLPDTNVTDVKHIKAGVVVTAGGEDYEGKFVVAADGVNSRIASLVGLNKNREFAGTYKSQTWLMEGGKLPDHEGLIFIITMSGMFSTLPLAEEGRFHLGTSSYYSNVDLEALLQKFTKKDPIYSSWFKNAKRLEHGESCTVNIWQAIEKPYKDHVIFVGDACWSMEFSNAASLCAGRKLGYALTKAFHDEKFDEAGLTQYLDWYTIYCFEPHGRGDLGSGGNLWDYLTAEELDYLAALPKKPAPHTLSFYKLFKTISETYKGLLPQISKEKPEIMEKLKVMWRDSKEAKARVKKAGFPNR